MKKILIYIPLLLIGITACEKFDQDIEAPQVSVSYFPEIPKVGDTVTVTISTNAEYLTIFTGDSNHEFSKSRIKAIMENNWESFYDTCYKKNLAPEGYACTWNRYFKDYKTIADVNKDFEFFGAISNIELGVYGDKFPEALLNVKYPDKNQLKFTVTDRRIPSGFIFKPHIYLFGGKANQPGLSIFETRFVSCDIDRAIRKKGANVMIPAYFDITAHNNETLKDSTFYGQLSYFRTFQTNDILSARPTEGYYNFSDFYAGFSYLNDYMNNNPEKIEMSNVKVYVNGRSTLDLGNYNYDLDGDGTLESYSAQLDPSTGLPVNENDYNKYEGFQGDVYLSYLEVGTNEYEPWNTGVSLGSTYSMTGIQKVYKYVYTKSGSFTITAVGTTVGRKNVEDIDYSKSRGNSLDDYDTKRSKSEITINVGN
ncbi:MAG: hypothetical protein ABFC90_04645 [Bacteroidales bacterium]|nr:hypothetical protein [Bacteroidales bacterium]MCK9310805.1 hypothetical protein [Bacteroidales bacterium]